MIEVNFNDFQLSSELLKAISFLNFKSPTKVQEQVIPAVLEQKDISSRMACGYKT
jgi:ATP-dependent RNA helicase DeaD